MKFLRPILNDKGLTLVELMIVLVLSLLLMAAVYLTYQLQHATGQSQLQVTATQQDLRASMEIISLDIMHAGADPTLTQTIQGVVENTSGLTSLKLRMDLNSDGNTNGANENITYSLTGNNLERVDIGSGVIQLLANNVTQLSFTYFGTQYTPINPTGGGNTLTAAEAQSVRYVHVNIIKNSDKNDPQTGQPVTRSLQRTICRRNGI
jgi:prepilin-type N-terminal cleavage/methylation domain-containing protein